MRNFYTFSAFLGPILSFSGLFGVLISIRRAERGDRTVLPVIVANLCPRTAGAPLPLFSKGAEAPSKKPSRRCSVAQGSVQPAFGRLRAWHLPTCDSCGLLGTNRGPTDRQSIQWNKQQCLCQTMLVLVFTINQTM